MSIQKRSEVLLEHTWDPGRSQAVRSEYRPYRSGVPCTDRLLCTKIDGTAFWRVGVYTAYTTVLVLILSCKSHTCSCSNSGRSVTLHSFVAVKGSSTAQRRLASINDGWQPHDQPGIMRGGFFFVRKARSDIWCEGGHCTAYNLRPQNGTSAKLSVPDLRIGYRINRVHGTTPFGRSSECLVFIPSS